MRGLLVPRDTLDRRVYVARLVKLVQRATVALKAWWGLRVSRGLLDLVDSLEPLVLVARAAFVVLLAIKAFEAPR
jgi:hypothetical protein